jgi:hypothetical protein
MIIDYEGNKIAWVSWDGLNYSPEHVQWIMPYLYDLREGRYPLRHKETGYKGGSTSRRSTAPFENACLIAAELDRRLARTGLDRHVVELYYCEQWQPDRIAKHLSLTEDDVWQKLDNAVSYIASGECPRWLDCRDCGRLKKCRKKGRLKRRAVDYREWGRRKNRERKHHI